MTELTIDTKREARTVWEFVKSALRESAYSGQSDQDDRAIEFIAIGLLEARRSELGRLAPFSSPVDGYRAGLRTVDVIASLRELGAPRIQ